MEISMNGFFRDLQFGGRLFAKGRLVTAIVVVTLALGIGVTSTIVSLIGSVLVAPFPELTNPKTVVWMFESRGEVDRSREQVSIVDFLRWKAEMHALQSIAAFSSATYTVEGHGEPDAVRGAAVSANYFQVLGTHIAAGRDFNAEEENAGHEHVAILGHAYAEKRFGTAAAAIGQSLSLSGTTYGIIGVLPVSFAFPQAIPVFVPLVFTPEMRRDGRPSIVVLGRRAPGVTTEATNAELLAIGQRLAEERPDTHRGKSIVALGLTDVFIGKRGRAISLLTLLAALLTLAVASINVGNILLAQGAARRSEIALRAALGASRVRIMLQLLTECLLLCAIGGLLGVMVSSWGLSLFAASMPERTATRMKIYFSLRFDERWIVVALGLTIFTTLVAGLLPAWRLSETKVAEAFKEQGAQATASKGHRRLLKTLVTGQITIALVLLSGAVWCLLDLTHIERTKLGLDPNGVLICDIEREAGDLAWVRGHDQPREHAAFFRDLLRGLSTIPGLGSTALASQSPMERGFDELRVAVPGRPPAEPGKPLWSAMTAIEGDYFAALRIAVLEGRIFATQDDAEGPRVAVLSRRAADLIFPGEQPLGKTLLLDEKTPSTVVGIVDDVVAYHHEEVGMIYLPLAQRPTSNLAVLMRGAGDPRQWERPLRDVVRALDSHQPLSGVMPLATHLDEHLWGPRTTVRLIAIPGMLAMLLALLGIYGVAAHSASQRRSELGIRAALGASPRALVQLVMSETLSIATVGAGIGLPLSIILVQALGNAGGVQLLSVLETCALAAALFVLVLLASFGPARRASRVSPSLALRAS
jgi:putative ABC transport system permease protein